MVTNITDLVKVKGGAAYKKLTIELFPCEEANVALSMLLDATCNENGAIPHLLNFAFTLALNVLFIALIYVAFVVVAFYQATETRSHNRQVDSNNWEFVAEERNFDMSYENDKNNNLYMQ